MSFRPVEVPQRELRAVARSIFDLRAEFADGDAIRGTAIDERHNRVVVCTKHALPKLVDQLSDYLGTRVPIDQRLAP